MKKTVFLIAAVILLAAVFAGCSLIEGVIATPDIIIRIESFQAALNLPARTEIQAELIADNFAPYPTTSYSDQLDLTFWNDQFDPDYTYNFEIISSFDVEAVEATMTATYRDTGTEENPVDVTFKMFKDDDGEWLIEEYWEKGTAIVKYIEQP